MPARILVADGQKLVRDGVRALLSIRGKGFKVVGEAGCVNEVLGLSCRLKPDMVLVDADLFGGEVDAIHSLLHAVPRASIVGRVAPHLVSHMQEAGVSGVVLREEGGDELLYVLTAVAEGRSCISQGACTALRGGRQQAAKDNRHASVPSLSNRERQLLRLIASCHPIKQAADAMNVSVNTAYTYLRRIKAKLGYHTLAELIRYEVQTRMDAE